MNKLLLACLLPLMLQSAYAQSIGENSCEQKIVSQEPVSTSTPVYNISVSLNELKNNQVTKNFDLNGKTVLGQPFVFGNYKKVSYIQEVSNIDGVQKITPGIINDGFYGFVQPENIDNKVITNVCFNLTDLMSIVSTSTSAGTIQLPTTKENRINYQLDFSKEPVKKIKLSPELELVVSSNLVTL